ncbi:hypothetical protein [uncultured Duncaniella sp.]|uniref:hypothetical protein n=1 Tax=uncultured Duncaniella sp. TaxID=2768039 RepID=UPI0025B6F1EF|nr:hypothetical protein [uncultured Duncaniella sp.]
MADLYSLVKKQDEKIDDLLKTAKENKDMLVGIDTRLVSDPAPSQTASPVSSGPQKILVELPDNVATNESIGKLLDEKLPSASTNETVNNMLAALPDSLSNGVAKILTDNINGKVKDALYEGFRKEFAKERKALYDVVSDLRYKVQSLVTGQWWLATPQMGISHFLCIIPHFDRAWYMVLLSQSREYPSSESRMALPLRAHQLRR